MMNTNYTSNLAADIGGIITACATHGYSSTPNVHIWPGRYNEAEQAIIEQLHEIGLASVSAIRGLYTIGPNMRPAIMALVATDGSAWKRGVYMCMIEDDNSEPLFFLDTGDSYAYRDTISDEPSLRQWQHPWPQHIHLPAIISMAKDCIINLHARSYEGAHE